MPVLLLTASEATSILLDRTTSTTGCRDMFWRQLSVCLILIVVITCFILLVELSSDKTSSSMLQQPVVVTPRLYVICPCDYSGGRLGNKMFALAAMIGIGRRNGLTPVLMTPSPISDVFAVAVAVTSDLENTLRAGDVAVTDYDEHATADDNNYDKHTEHLLGHGRRTHVRLHGYFLSWRYFSDVTDDVRRQFTFHEHIGRRAASFIASVTPAGWRTPLPHHSKASQHQRDFVRVGIHVRVSDFYARPTVEYFQSAMRHFTTQYRRVQFIVCTDDVTWCRQNILSTPAARDPGRSSDVSIVLSSHNSAEVDLAILAQCHHTIMSVGTFGWWGAWLANGTTIYYADWLPQVNGTKRPAKYHFQRDFYPAHWIPL